MNETTDQQLVCAFAEKKSEAAFSELVRRHVDFVYSAAMRTLRDPHLAQDVTQGTFIALAQNCVGLTDRPVLAGWLHRTVRNLAGNTIRSEVRRRAREQEAATMNELLAGNDDADWETISPQLDAALEELGEEEREALLLRYFQKKTAHEIAMVCDISAEAAQKRVSRALEHLREALNKKNVSVGASGLAVVLSANALQAAPFGLVTTISAATSSLMSGAFTTTTLPALIKTAAMTTLQKSFITIALAASIGTAAYSINHATKLRVELATSQQKQNRLNDQLASLTKDNARLSNELGQAKNTQAMSQSQMNELLKLRGKATSAHSDSAELAKLKSKMVDGNNSGFFTNAMQMGLKNSAKYRKNAAQNMAARMKKMLNLSDDQYDGVSAIMLKEIDEQMQNTQNLLTGNATTDELEATRVAKVAEENQIKALLTPEQASQYPDFKQSEREISANTLANYESSQVATDFDLSKDQQTQVQKLFNDLNLKATDFSMTDGAKNESVGDAFTRNMELQQTKLESKITALSGILSPDQIATYRKEQTALLDMQAQAVKMLYPKK